MQMLARTTYGNVALPSSHDERHDWFQDLKKHIPSHLMTPHPEFNIVYMAQTKYTLLNCTSRGHRLIVSRLRLFTCALDIWRHASWLKRCSGMKSPYSSRKMLSCEAVPHPELYSHTSPNPSEPRMASFQRFHRVLHPSIF